MLQFTQTSDEFYYGGEMMKEKSKSLVESTADAIMEYFSTNDLNIGDRLPNEYTLAEALNVGRSTLREAIKILASKNIVEVRQGSGTYIVNLTETIKDPLGFSSVDNPIKLTQDLFEVRFLIEPQMASLAAQHITEDEVKVLESLEQALEKEIPHNSDTHFQLDIQFHSAIAEASRNVAMQQLIPIIIQSITLYNDFFTNRESKRNTIRAHREIIRAIKHHDAVAARDMMMLHLADNRRMLSEYYQEPFL